MKKVSSLYLVRPLIKAPTRSWFLDLITPMIDPRLRIIVATFLMILSVTSSSTNLFKISGTKPRASYRLISESQKQWRNSRMAPPNGNLDVPKKGGLDSGAFGLDSPGRKAGFFWRFFHRPLSTHPKPLIYRGYIPYFKPFYKVYFILKVIRNYLGQLDR